VPEPLSAAIVKVAPGICPGTKRITPLETEVVRAALEETEMLTLYSYPDLFGVADNNPYGLKVFAFLKLCRLAFRHEHILDATNAPRGQLPFLVDGDLTIGDSDTIISHLITRHRLSIDDGLTPSQKDTDHLVRRMLDDLYWVMSFSRWRDSRFWPLFRDAILRSHPAIAAAALETARDYNFKRYHYQGIGRYEPAAVYARGLADLKVLGNLLPESGFLFGPKPSSADAGIYGFIANIYFYAIDTPLKDFVVSQPNIVAHCRSIHAALEG
jgi:glutathione S-transferase